MENPHEIAELVRYSPNVFCVVKFCESIWCFFFAEPPVTGISHLDILENYLMPQLQHDMDRYFIFQQDGVIPALPSRGYFLTQSHGGCLDQT